MAYMHLLALNQSAHLVLISVPCCFASIAQLTSVGCIFHTGRKHDLW